MFYPYAYPYFFFGMHAFWWVFWLVGLFLIFGVAMPVPRKRLREYRASTPLAILQRRLAAGEITTEDYEQRKAIIDRDELAVSGRREERTSPAFRTGHRGA